SATAIEDDEVRVALERLAHALGEVRRPRRAGEAAATPAAADRRHTGQRSGLEVIRCRVRAGAREREQVVDSRTDVGDLRLRRPTTAHRDDDDVVVLRYNPSAVAG